jgi:hypothetical protein
MSKEKRKCKVCGGTNLTLESDLGEHLIYICSNCNHTIHYIAGGESSD